MLTRVVVVSFTKYQYILSVAVKSRGGGEDKSYVAKIPLSRNTLKLTTDIVYMLNLLIEQAFGVFGGHIFQQTLAFQWVINCQCEVEMGMTIRNTYVCLSKFLL